MEQATLAALNAARRERRGAVLATELVSSRSVLLEEGRMDGSPLADLAGAALTAGRSGIVELDGERWFLNAYAPAPRLVLIGAVHISQALVPMAQIAGFDVLVIDPRTAFATPERFGGVTLLAEWPQDALTAHPLDRYTALAALTHDPKIDDDALIAAIRAGCFYVGALGSRKTHASRRDRLIAQGLSDRQIDRIHAPIGFDLGASSPAEIAVAVLAQVIGALRHRASVAAQAREEERILDA